MKWRLLPIFIAITLVVIGATLFGFFLGKDRDSQRTELSTESSTTAAGTSENVKMYTYEIVRKLPHDARAFTQGLEYEVNQGLEVFWESTGLYRKSQLREVRFPLCDSMYLRSKCVIGHNTPRHYYGNMPRTPTYRRSQHWDLSYFCMWA